jgi:prepilin-type N-terminal cleavage/methylation domain-containing protein
VSKNKAHGFTLVEVLLTMAILTMLMLTAAYAYNFITQNWKRNQQLYERELAQYKSATLVYRAVADTQPKIVKGKATASLQGASSRPGFYFLGRDNGFTAYTNTAAQDPAYPAVYRLFRERSDNGQFSLIYEEAMLNNVLLTRAEQNLPFSFRLTVATGLNELNFEYYGWASAQAKMAADPETGNEFGSPEWFNEYDGMQRVQHPLVVQVIVEDFLWPIQVIDVSSELLNRSLREDE